MSFTSIDYVNGASSGGSPGASVPAVANALGATIVERPAGTRVSGRLTYPEIDGQLTWDQIGDPFLASGFALSTATLVERGIRLGNHASATPANTAITAANSYTGGSATSGSIATVYTGGTDAGDVDLGAFTPNGSFTSWTAADSVMRTSAGANDPIMTTTLTYSNGSVSKTAQDSTRWVFPIYYGVSALTSLTGAQILALSGKLLATSRVNTYALSPSLQYIYVAWADIAQYTAGTVGWIDQLTQQGFDMGSPTTVSVTGLYGITVNYKVYRSVNVLTVPFSPRAS